MRLKIFIFFSGIFDKNEEVEILFKLFEMINIIFNSPFNIPKDF